jgi:Spy/CpxP family protein refolding chaperone
MSTRQHQLALALTVLSGLLAAASPVFGQDPPDNRPPPPPRNDRPDRPPPRGDRPERPGERGRRGGPQQYSLEQAISDNAQLHTIAFSGLAFITGDFGAATFLPPGKVCDFFGFQYMRDIDAAETGHNPKFLDRIAGNVLKVLTDEQRAKLEALAREQAPQFRELAERRWPLIKAFYRELNGDIPAGSSGLNEAAVAKYVGDLFAFDAELSYRRAQVVGGIVAAFTPEQKAYLAKMKFGDFSTWPDVEMDQYKLPRGTEKLVNVAYMTYASELFSWYAGSIEADVYFCPERHGTYFGGFYMKDMPAMGKRDYDISTSVTGDSGQGFLRTLTEEQRRFVTAIPDQQRKALREIVDTRRAIATELRKFLTGEQADKEKVLSLGRRYGELDGELSYYYATAFAKANKTLTAEQRKELVKLRNLEGYTSAPAYVYSDAVRDEPKLPETDRFFFPPK